MKLDNTNQKVISFLQLPRTQAFLAKGSPAKESLLLSFYGIGTPRRSERDLAAERGISIDAMRRALDQALLYVLINTINSPMEP